MAHISYGELRVDALMSAYQGEVPGASVAVLREGSFLLSRVYGMADLELKVGTTSSTNYRLASVTKQFTAAAVLLLVEEGRLRLDERIIEWLPDLPAAAAAISIRHLLTHTSGLLDYEDLIAPDTVRQLRDADVLRLLEAQERTYFPPGTCYRYSNGGYALLALTIEAASGTSFASFLRARIFEPLGMRGTVAFEDGISTVRHRAFGYAPADKGVRGVSWVRADQNLTSAVLGDGGIYSSIEDLARWDAALYDGRLLDPKTLRLAFAPATATEDPKVSYGFGWRISGDSLWHSGESTGFRNVIVRLPKSRLSVLVLTNRDHPEPYATALAIADLYLAR
jgi:CubicO group peptidase (beta-lactamase class C family)